MPRSFRLLEYTLASLLRRKFKNLSLIAVYTLTVAALGSVLFLTHALKTEAVSALSTAPEIVVQRISAGRHDPVPVSYADEIRKLPGVKSVTPRVWGYYYDSLIKANLTLMGVSGESLEDVTLLDGRWPSLDSECVIGAGVVSEFGPQIGDILALEDSRGFSRELAVTGVFQSESSLLTNDLVVLPETALRNFFNMDASLATDLSVAVYNAREIKTLAKKIKYQLPDTRPITRDEILHTYESVFHWRSGMMLAVSVGALIAFCILAWDKATGISAEERREIGLLKALGWGVSDVLVAKAWEGFAVSFTSFLLGILIAWLHVFFWGAPLLAPLLKGWSVLYPEFQLSAVVDYYQVFVLMILTVGPYMACTLLPSWKAAIIDPDQVLRG